MALGKAMVADHEPIKEGPDPEESGIPAVYTYLGQFIDHDLTFDPASSLQQQDDPDGLVDFRTPRFDLDNVYGKGPDDAPYLYHADNTFILGRKLTGAASNPNARDLPRSRPDDKDPDDSAQEDLNNPRRAIIGDPRNDENLIVSQLQGLQALTTPRGTFRDQRCSWAPRHPGGCQAIWSVPDDRAKRCPRLGEVRPAHTRSRGTRTSYREPNKASSRPGGGPDQEDPIKFGHGHQDRTPEKHDTSDLWVRSQLFGDRDRGTRAKA